MLNVAPPYPSAVRTAPTAGPKPAWAYMEGLPGEPVASGGEPIGGAVKSLNPNLVTPFINHAKKFLGQPYLWGGGHSSATKVGPVDCSGLMLQAARMAGFNIDGTARMQQDMGRPISMNELKPGDLLFHGDPATHVGLYIGEGKFIHAPGTGRQIEIRDVKSYGYFNNARRIFDFSNGGPAPAPQPAPTPDPRPEPKPRPQPADSPAGPVPGTSSSPAGPIPSSSSSHAGPIPTASVSPAGPIPTYQADVATFTAPALAAAPVALAPAPAPVMPPTPWAWRTVQPGESLPRLALALLGDMNRWPEIHALNPDLVPNPNVLMPGQTIRVPATAPAPVAAAMPAAPTALAGQLSGLQQLASGMLSRMTGRPA